MITKLCDVGSYRNYGRNAMHVVIFSDVYTRYMSLNITTHIVISVVYEHKIPVWSGNVAKFL